MSSHSRIEEWKSSLHRKPSYSHLIDNADDGITGSFRCWQSWVCENVTTRSETALSFYFSGIPFCYTGIILVSECYLLPYETHADDLPLIKLLAETERLRIYAGAPRKLISLASGHPLG